MVDTVRLTSYLLANEFQDGQPNGTITPQFVRDLILSLAQRQLVVALSDEVSNLVVNTTVLTFRIAEPMTLTDCRLNCSVAPVGGAITVDVKQAGVSIFSTKPTIASGSLTSVGGTPCVFTATALTDDAVITFDINTIGSTTAGKGLKVALIGRRT